jgi:hypothetical protein
MEYGHERNMTLPCHRRARDKALHYPWVPAVPACAACGIVTPQNARYDTQP